MPISAASDDVRPVGQPLADAGSPAAGELDGLLGDSSLTDPAGDLGEPEHAQRDRDQGDAVAEEQRAEGEPLLGGRGRGADEAEQESEEAGGQALDDVAAREHGGERDAEDGQHEELRAAEGQHQGPSQRDGEGEPDRADQAAGHRGEEGERQCAFGLSLPRHRVAVEHRHARRGGAGRAEQDGGDRVRGVHHGQCSDEHRECRLGLHAERDREEDRHRAGAAETRDQADDETGHHADGEHDEERGIGQGGQGREGCVSHVSALSRS